MSDKDFLFIDNDLKDVAEDFVTVSIKAKDGYSWTGEGNAGMVVRLKGHASDVDMVGDGKNVVKLLATAMIKVKQIVGPSMVEKAIELYRKA